jgi:hypothetical protein
MAKAPPDGPDFALLALKAAEDLALRLLERRVTSPGKVPGLVDRLGRHCLALLEGDPVPRLPYLRHAASLTGRLIERGSLSEPGAICQDLDENMAALKEIAASAPDGRAKEVLASTVSLVMKMLETKSLSASSVPETLRAVAASVGSLLK